MVLIYNFLFSRKKISSMELPGQSCFSIRRADVADPMMKRLLAVIYRSISLGFCVATFWISGGSLRWGALQHHSLHFWTQSDRPQLEGLHQYSSHSWVTDLTPLNPSPCFWTQERLEFCIICLKSVRMQDKYCNTLKQCMATIPPHLPSLRTGVNLS